MDNNRRKPRVTLVKWLFVVAATVAVYLVFVSGGSGGQISVPEPSYKQVHFDVQQAFHNAKRSHLKKQFESMSARNLFSGQVMYAEHGQIVYEASLGYEDLIRKREALTDSSAFQLASVSKMFTATAIMILKEEGKLQFDDDVSEYIFGFPYSGITIRHLLVHRSGLPNYMYLADKHLDQKRPMTNRDVVDLLVKYRPNPAFLPDNGFHYCNTNYALLACVVEAASKLSFDRFIKSRIFIPAGMHNSFVYNHNGLSEVPRKIPVGIQGHEARGKRLIQVPDYYINGVMGDKGVYATVHDLYRFDLALNSGLLVSDETLSEAFSPGSPYSSRRKDNYGFGWRIRDDMDSTVYHFGWWKGFRTYYIRDIAKQRTLIVLCNHARGISPAILWDILKEDETELLLSVYRELRHTREADPSGQD